MIERGLEMLNRVWGVIILSRIRGTLFRTRCFGGIRFLIEFWCYSMQNFPSGTAVKTRQLPALPPNCKAEVAKLERESSPELLEDFRVA